MYSGKVGLCLMVFRVLNRPLQVNLFNKELRSLSLGASNCQYKNKHSVYIKNKKSYHADPGLGHRLKIIKKDTPDVDSSAISEEDFEELESDFLNARQMQVHHMREVEKLRHRDEMKMTERKYFKQVVEPNMLTWSEKEQIRHLHREDPLIWNIDRLAESFPATQEIIKKIIKSSWRPECYDRIKKHDEMVASNWKAFKDGKLDINCSFLREHLRKFTKRTSLTFNQGFSETFEALPKPKGSEFNDIINSYKSLNNDNRSKYNVEENRDGLDADTSIISEYCNNKNQIKKSPSGKKDDFFEREFNAQQGNGSLGSIYRSHYTLEKLRDKIMKKQSDMESGCLNEQVKVLLKGSSTESVTVAKQTYTMETMPVNHVLPTETDNLSMVHVDEQVDKIASYNVKTNVDVITRNNIGDYSNTTASSIRKRIHIPKSKVKIGFLYKVNDCFYSHDGFFLYRIPGLGDER